MWVILRVKETEAVMTNLSLRKFTQFVLVLAPMAVATIIPTVLSWRWYRAEQQ